MMVILEVDDDSDDREMFLDAVNAVDPGISCIQVESGLDALAYLADASPLPDFIFMDVNMPKMDGVEATRIIKQQCPDIAIIGLSVNNSRQVEAAMHAAGASAYLTKDTAPEQLYNTISAVLIKRLTDK